MPGTSSPPRRPYRGETAEHRRSARRERLLAAGLDVLGEEGYAGTTVRGVCARARLTPRYFYESFDDLDGLLVAVFDRIVAEATAAVLAAVEAAPPDAHGMARAAIETFVRDLTDDPRRARIAFVEALGSEALMRRRFEAMRRFSRLVAAQGGDFYGAPGDGDPLADMTATVLVGGMAELLLTWLDGSLRMSRDELVADFTELFVATGETAVAISRRRSGRANRGGRP
jgi:AcrR family transcriptional regulator